MIESFDPVGDATFEPIGEVTFDPDAGRLFLGPLDRLRIILMIGEPDLELFDPIHGSLPSPIDAASSMESGTQPSSTVPLETLWLI